MSALARRIERFYNRTDELAALERAWSRPGRGLMGLLYGRRRIGKTYLLQRFCAGSPGEPPRRHCYYLADQTTAPNQRLALATQALASLPDPAIASPDEIAVSWNAIMHHVSSHCGEGERFVLILDEFPYLSQESPELPSIIQSWWDREGRDARIMTVLCGSQLSTMEALGEATAPLYGRFDAGIWLLEPLRYDDVALFYADSEQHRTAQKLLMYGVLGGTPRYHAMVDPARPMAHEIVDLLLRPGAPLENEVEFLLGSRRIRESAPYNAVLRAIARGATQFGEILGQSGTERGRLSFYLSVLQDLRWVVRELPFGETSARRGLYRIADPFLRFWYRFVAPLASERQFTDPDVLYSERIAPYLADYMGLHVFGEVCRQWLRRHGRERLRLSIRADGRYWSRDGRIEIDLVAALAEGGYLLAECKWSERSPVGVDVYSHLRAKVASLPDASWRADPRFALFSLGGFTPELEAMAAASDGQLSLIGPADLLLG